MSKLSELFSNAEKVLSGKKKILPQHTTLGKIVNHPINKMSDIFAGGERRKNIGRRFGHMGTGAVSGAITGGKTGGLPGAIIGAIGGGALGYQSKKPVTGKAAFADVGKGVGAGLVGGGIANFFNLGSAPVAAKPTAGINGVTKAGGAGAKGFKFSDFVSNMGPGFDTGGYQRQPYNKWEMQRNISIDDWRKY
jgi:hypothetical protein